MTTSTHVSTSGGLISAAFIENVREPGSRQRGVQPASFALPQSPAPKSPAALEDTIAAAWELLLERWDAVRHDLPLVDTSQVRSRWLLPLFHLLDFDPVYLRGDTVLDAEGRLRYRLSHRGWQGSDSLVLHTVIPSQDLDSRLPGASGAKPPPRHPPGLLQRQPGRPLGGAQQRILLRLLRDYHHTFTKGYVELDLESIFETRNYGDFRALYRLCHASRFLPPSPKCICIDRGEGELPVSSTILAIVDMKWVTIRHTRQARLPHQNTK